MQRHPYMHRALPAAAALAHRTNLIKEAIPSLQTQASTGQQAQDLLQHMRSAAASRQCSQEWREPPRRPPPGGRLLVRLDVVRVGPQDDGALQHAGEGQVLLAGQLGALAHAQQHRRRVRLEARDRLGPPRLPPHQRSSLSISLEDQEAA